MIVYLARHGQTTGDIENRYGGDYDDHLTKTGEQQSEQLAGKLASKHIEALFASPKIRAQEAAAIISARLGLHFTMLEDFRERNGYGIMTGMKKEDAIKQYPEFVAGLKNDVHFNVEGAEPYMQFRGRIEKALEAATKLPYEHIAIVTHGGPIRLIFREVLGLGEININDCAFAAIDVVDGRYDLLDMSGIILQHNDSRPLFQRSRFR